MTPDNMALAPDLMEILREANQEIPEELLELAETARTQRKGKEGFPVTV